MDDNPLTPEVLESLGVNLDDEAKQLLAQHSYEQLQERIGGAIAELLSEDEAKELADLSQNADDATLQTWLEAHVPDYQAVIQDETTILLAELAKNANNV
ncbi:hypothetical protein TM7_0106 [candidate division TM7 genomosp. GTL1]|nr:hypothetical protein TM7_0106 [candidate division TM7 genomosp. GTL1]